ncbi:MAG: clostripain-related cysteine peptidase, partial [Flavitalea sp.]
MNEMRKTTRSFFTLIALLVLFSTPAGNAFAAPKTPKAKWTVMVYMSGDNYLEDYVVKDIEEELALTGSNADIKILALGDRSPDHNNSVDSRVDWQTTNLFYVTQGMLATPDNAVADWGERNMGDKQTLIDFVTWSKANYPADHYALYFWGRGWNWHPGWFMEDDTEQDTLDYEEVKAAIPSLGFIDMVGFDGCDMASIEIHKLWRG